jgi:di/tripeptidase
METQNRKLLPFELRLMVIEEAFSEDRISRYTFMDERVQAGYPDWRPQLKSQHLRIFMEHYNNLQTTSLKINFINLKAPRESLKVGVNYFF